MYHSDATRRVQRTPGQLRARVEELKNPWRQCSPWTLSHNESVRLATDALLEQGEEAYLQALTDEKELPFLSSLDIEYVRDNTEVHATSPLLSRLSVDLSGEDGLSELTSGTYFPLMSDIDAPMLELGWPEISPLTKHRPTEVNVHFQRDRSNTIKDLLRSLINNAKSVIAIVMDLFTDVDILCDLVAAANKRSVAVYLLLDKKNLDYFIEMWEKLDFKSMKVPNLKVRTITGSTYCTKSGRKFSGQFLEKFALIDCEQVIAGTYSFNWIASQVHSHMVTHFIGKIVEAFDTEFRCLYAVSNKVDYFEKEDQRGNAYTRPMAWNTQPLLRSAHVQTPVLSNASSGDSISSSSSVKESPFTTTGTVYEVIHEDRRSPSPQDFTDPARRDVTAAFKMNLNQNRRFSNPNTGNLANTDYASGLNNKPNLPRTSLFSKSTPVLEPLEEVPNSAQRTITETTDLQPENRNSPEMKNDRASNLAVRVNQFEGDKKANADRVGYGENSKEQNGNFFRNGKRMTLGHSNLDMMLKYRRSSNTGIGGLQPDSKTPTTVKVEKLCYQADTANEAECKKNAHAPPADLKDSSKDQSSKVTRNEYAMNLGHSNLDMMTNFRPRLANTPPTNHTTSTNVKSDSSPTASATSNYTDSKKEVCPKPSFREAQTNDQKAMTLGHSKLDMISKARPPPTAGFAALQLDKTPAGGKSNITSTQTISEKDTSTAPEGVNQSPRGESNNWLRNDRRNTLGHSKLDMMTNHNKERRAAVYSRFRP